MADNPEILDIVNEQDEVIGTIDRRDYDRLVTEKLGYLRSVDMYIQNDKGQLWVPRRTLDKTIAPGGLDYSVGGHVESGETYEDALLREIKEELNLTLTLDDLEFVTLIQPGIIPYFRKFYLYHSNDAPVYNPEDFTEYFWLTPTELAAKIRSGEPAKVSILETLSVLL